MFTCDNLKGLIYFCRWFYNTMHLFSHSISLLSCDCSMIRLFDVILSHDSFLFAWLFQKIHSFSRVTVSWFVYLTWLFHMTRLFPRDYFMIHSFSVDCFTWCIYFHAIVSKDSFIFTGDFTMFHLFWHLIHSLSFVTDSWFISLTRIIAQTFS